MPADRPETRTWHDTVDLGGVEHTHPPGAPEAPSPGPLPFLERELIGQGGSSVVFRVFDPVLRRRTALKILSRTDQQKRFLREARIMAQLEHPHIVPVYGYGLTDGGAPWIQMQLVDGHTLGDHVAALGPDRLDPDHLLDLLDALERVCAALAYTHSKGVLHLDLKPANVMIGAYGRVQVMDWGIAKVIRDDVLWSDAPDGRFFGTPAYVAPEQVTAPETVDERTDVYALGGLLHHVLALRAPRTGGSARTLLARARHGEVDPLDTHVDRARMPEGLVRLAAHALAPHPDDRPPTVVAFQERLRRLRRGAWLLPVRAVPAGEAIVRTGDVGDEAFIVERGTCEVRRADGTPVRTLGPGDVFGELAVLGDRPRSMDVVAVTDVRLQVVRGRQLTERLGDGSWAGRFAKALVDRFHELEARAPQG